DTARARYASVVLYRLMFLYFLQHLGLFDGDPFYLQRNLALVREQRPDGKGFYRDFLKPLFTLADQLKPFSVPLATLFVEHAGECDYPDLALPDEIFERLFAFFDKYTWQARKQSVSARNVLNYEILERLFEQEVSQKEMGAYYTP